MDRLDGPPRLILVADLDCTLVDHDDPENTHLLRFNALWEAHYRHDSLLVYSTGRSMRSYLSLRNKKPLLTPDIAITSVETLSSRKLSKFSQLEPQPKRSQEQHKVSFYVEREHAVEIMKVLPGILMERGVDVKMVYSNDYAFDVLPGGSGKGGALTYLLEKLENEGEQSSNVLVCGDSGNDAELFNISQAYGVMVSNSHKELLQWHEENAKDNPNIILASERCAAGIIEALQRFNLGPSVSPRDVLDAERFYKEILDPAHEVVQFYLLCEKWRCGEVEKSDNYLQNLKLLSSPLGMFVHPSGVEKSIHEWIDDLENLHGEGKEKQFHIWLDKVSSSRISSDTWIVKFDKHELSEGKVRSCSTRVLLSCQLTHTSSVSFLQMATLHTRVFFLISILILSKKASSQLDELWLVGDDDDDPLRALQTRHERREEKCDYSLGKWSYDETYPLYDSNCPYLSSALSCQRNGRPDSYYQKWRWVPKFDALKFLGKMRQKRIMLVGDSIMRNQWESLVCLVQSVLPTHRKKLTYNGPTMSFRSLDFETSIEFCWAPLLVELKKGSDRERVLHLDSIEDNARYWRGVDVLVFDSAHWWTHSQKRSSWDYYKDGNKLYKAMNPMVAYERGLTTWAEWVEINLDPSKTKVIFRTSSPRESGQKCYNQKHPLPSSSEPHVPQQSRVLKKVLMKMKYRVYLHDITTMSAYRRDGHPSVFKRAMGEEEKHHRFAGPLPDCSHWCLPGVPDIWNEMLSSIILTKAA
ncbi:unnamed protein product [Brassica napus]|uniref:(rape) hypothetical protein n=1 Tax=Brassica napus TaxID=3708 RepID=A0A817B0T0_BRANA|nr:unnamed protein product [Brassica napus]